MAALVRRRSLVQSPWFAASYSFGDEKISQSDFIDRLSVSISFANQPTLADFTMLKNWSVGFYVVDLEVAPSNYWINSDAKVYENESYLVIDLNKVKLN